MILRLFAAARAEDPAPPAAAEPTAPPPAASDGPGEAPPDAPAPDAPDDDLAPYRIPFDVLADRTIGTTSRPVEFNWRRTDVQVGGSVGFLAELNNFNSAHGGAVVRVPSGNVLLELGVSGVDVWDTPSSRTLALTPYRQAGRPPRMEIDAGISLPLAEGVVTVAPRWFPAVELVFDLYGGIRYSLYPTGFRGMKFGKIVGAALDPSLQQTEIDNLEDARLDAMKVDPGRYGLVVGFGNELYFKPGLFVSPRVITSLPLLAAATGSELGFWADVSLAVGAAF